MKPWHIHDPCILKPEHIKSPKNTQKPAKHVQRAVFCRTQCNTGIWRARGIFRTLSNTYDGKFYSQPCVTLAYLEPWHIQNSRLIQNTAKHLSQKILFKTLYNPDIFRTLSIIRTLVYFEIKAYSEHCRISKM